MTPWLKLVVMCHGETIAMLLKDRAGGRRVSDISHISVASHKRCFGTTCGPFGVHFYCSVFNIFLDAPWMPRCSFWELRGCLGFHFCSFGRLQCYIFGALGMPGLHFCFWVCPGLHFGSLGGPLGSILAKFVASGSPFFYFWVSPRLHFGGLGGSLGSFSAKLVASGAPWGFQCPPSRPKPNFLKFSPPLLEAFSTIFGGKNRLKNR